MTQRELAVSLGKKDDFAVIERTWHGTFEQLVERLLKNVKDTEDKAVPGWVCGATFLPEYRHSSNFVQRNLLSLDYDHITSDDLGQILTSLCGRCAFLAYTTWSHRPDAPRLRVWIPLSRGATDEEFQAVSRRLASTPDIELAARESHVASQFMFRPASQKGIAFQSWQDTTSPYLDVDQVLGEYDDWKDRSTWPHRAEGDSCHEPGEAGSALDKPGIIGEFNRAFSISAAIERFGLPYRNGSSEGRWTFTAGSRADGAVAYDDDTKLHSYHDTDPARGQHNAYDLVRLHLYGNLDGFDGEDLPIADRESSKRMAKFAAEQPEIAAADFASLGFTDLEAVEAGAVGPAVGCVLGPSSEKGGNDVVHALPPPIPAGSSKDSDLENARRIQAQYGKEVLAVAEGFYVWSGTHWVKSSPVVRKLIANLSEIVRREAAGLLSAGDEKQGKRLFHWAAQCGSAGTMSACEKLLRSYLDFPPENLNADRALLTCRTGTIDLRTGSCGPHRQADFITACAPTAFDPAATCPRFQLFLREIFRNDASVVAFAKRWFGYCLTGETTEHALVFHVGEGGNGKGKLLGILQHVLGPGYAGIGPRSLLSPGGAGASPEVAGLLGQRMVTMNETNRDEEFNEGVLKNLTGGDRLKARHLYEGYFEFEPTHKLQIFTNYEPRIVGLDRGLWRRLFLLKYEVKYGRDYEVAAGIAQEVQDDDLSVKLAAEAPGILAWLVEGAQEWYRDGLNPPASVRQATEDFRARQDHVGQFLSERTVKDPHGSVAASSGTESLYVAYKGWMQEMGYRWLGRNKFMAEIRRAAPWTEYDHRTRTFRGLSLKKEVL